MFAGTEAAFRAVVEEGQRAGEIDAGRDAADLASLLLNTVVGIRVMARTADGPERLRRVVDGLFALL